MREARYAPVEEQLSSLLSYRSYIEITGHTHSNIHRDLNRDRAAQAHIGSHKSIDMDTELVDHALQDKNKTADCIASGEKLLKD